METESHGSVESRSFGNALRSIGRLILPRGNSNSANKQRSARSGSSVTSGSNRSEREAPQGTKSKNKSKKRTSSKTEESATNRGVQSSKNAPTSAEVAESPSPTSAGSNLLNFMRRRSSKQKRPVATTVSLGDANSTNSSVPTKSDRPSTKTAAIGGTVVVDVHALAGPSASVYSNSSADSSLHSAVLTSTAVKPQAAFAYGTSQPTQSAAVVTCDTEDESLVNATEKSSISLSSAALQSVQIVNANNTNTTNNNINFNASGSSQSRLCPAGSTFECPLCMNEVASDSVPRLINCRHKACRSCLSIYLRTEITEGRVQIACPTCSERLHPADIEQLLVDQPRLVDKYSEFMVRRVLLNDPDARWCPAPDCGYAVIATSCGACPRLACERPGCGTQFCYHCKSFWHADGRACPALRFASSQTHAKDRGGSRERAFPHAAALLRAAPSGLRELVDVGALGDSAMVVADGGLNATRASWSAGSVAVSSGERGAVSEVKPCPRCGALIIKMQDGSCNHMTCILCGAEFCWLCLREISDWHYLSPSGCTFWGKRVWSRKKKIFWQLGILVGAPLFIALMATVSVPAILIGVPIWVGRKLHAANATRSKRRRTLTVTAGVVAAVTLSPVLATFAVSIGVPVLLAYVYGVIPISLCKSNACGAGGSLDDDDSSPSPFRLFDDDSSPPQRLALPTADGSRVAKGDEASVGRTDTQTTLDGANERRTVRGSRALQTAREDCDESAIVSSVSVGDACSAAGSLGGPALLSADTGTVDTASGVDDNAYLQTASVSKKRVTIGGQHCHPHSASFEYAENETDADVDTPTDGVTVRVVQPADCDADDADRQQDDAGRRPLNKGRPRTSGPVRHASFSKRRDARPSPSCLVQSPSSATAPMMSSIGDVSSCVSYSQIAADQEQDRRAASSCDKPDTRGDVADYADADRESASRRAMIGTSCEPSLNGDAASMRSGKMVLTPSDADDDKRLLGAKATPSSRDAGNDSQSALRQRHAATPTMLTGVGAEYDDAALLTQDNASTKCLSGSLLINMDTFSIRDTSIALDDVSSLNNVLSDRAAIASPHTDDDAERQSDRDHEAIRDDVLQTTAQ